MRNGALAAVGLLFFSTLACGEAAPPDRRPLSRLPPGSTKYYQDQGQQLQGRQAQGNAPVGTAATEPPIYHRYSSWWNDGWLSSARLVKGELQASGRSGMLSGAALSGTWIPADDAGKAVWTVVRSASQDPTYGDGSTWLYSIDLYDSSSGTLSPLCVTDANGVAAAIPIAALFDGAGNRIESTTQFSFACTRGVIAKCYRWGYRPWLADATGSSLRFSDLHWACTRLARADYCGDGRTWTQNGTRINVWDTAPAPGPFQLHGPSDPTFFFEAGWNTKGAVCLSKQRWATLNPQIAQNCPNKLIAPGASTSAGTVCDTPEQAALFDSSTQLFDESKANVSP
jgi:hypothetical protein